MYALVGTNYSCINTFICLDKFKKIRFLKQKNKFGFVKHLFSPI